jgi:hypothetical protein
MAAPEGQEAVTVVGGDGEAVLGDAVGGLQGRLETDVAKRKRICSDDLLLLLPIWQIRTHGVEADADSVNAK